MEPAPKGDDFLELWKWYSKVRALIGSMQTQAVMQKRSPRSMYSQGVLTFRSICDVDHVIGEPIWQYAA